MLRPYQSDIITRTRVALRTHRSVCIQLPTGGGKTVIFADIAARATDRDRRVLMLAHRKELIRQAAATLTRGAVAHSLIMPRETFRPDLLAAVASVQTLRKRSISPWSPDVIIVDEAHHAAADSYREILGRWPKAQIIGVTATPVRGDGRGLADIFGALVCGPTAADLIASGYLKPVEVYEGSALDDSALRKIGGEFSAGSQENAAERPKLIGDAVHEYAKICPGLPAIAFCVSVAEAENVATQFQMAGWRARAVHGSSPDRTEILEALRDGRLDVVTSCDLIGEGTDIPRCACVILLRATQSIGLYLQMCGRGLRPHKDFSTCYVLDHGGNYARHQVLPDDAIEWTLEHGVRRSRKRTASRCRAAALRA